MLHSQYCKTLTNQPNPNNTIMKKRALKYLLAITLALLSTLPAASAQTLRMFAPKLDPRINPPRLESLAFEPDRQMLIPLNLFYGTASSLTFGFGDSAYTDIDSLKPYLLSKLRDRDGFHRFQVAVAIVADSEVKMRDVALIQEELKRFRLLKVFFVGLPKEGANFPPDWNRGRYYKLPPRDEENIERFYQLRNLAPRQPENLISITNQEEEERRKKEGPDYGKDFPPSPPPPPPPPPPPLPRKYDPATMANIPGLQAVVIDITDSDEYILNGQPVEESVLFTAITGYLGEGECMFVLRPEGMSTYGKYVQVIDVVSTELEKLRREEALKQYGTAYDELSYSNRRKVNNQFPFMIIDEPVYYRGD